jgi:hypothetical protein
MVIDQSHPSDAIDAYVKITKGQEKEAEAYATRCGIRLPQDIDERRLMLRTLFTYSETRTEDR